MGRLAITSAGYSLPEAVVTLSLPTETIESLVRNILGLDKVLRYLSSRMRRCWLGVSDEATVKDRSRHIPDTPSHTTA